MARFSFAILLIALAALAQPALCSNTRRLLAGSSCPDQIPSCDTNRCVLQTVDGKRQSVCERCKAPYAASTNRLNCVCPPGFYEACDGTTCTCKTCDKAFFCPGGNEDAQNAAPASEKGQRLSCIKGQVVPANSTSITTTVIESLGLTTKSTRAKRHSDCVPTPGFYLKATTRPLQEASLCQKGTYSPGYGRIRQCLKCQSGTEENPAMKYADTTDALAAGGKLRKDKLEVCQVPAGTYLSQNVVRDCPPGSFSTSFRMVAESSSRYCFNCPTGLTTNVTRPKSPGDCSVIQAGLQLTQDDLTKAQALAQAVADGTGGLDQPVDPAKCPYGTYFEGGVLTKDMKATCKTCPYGTTTQTEGSTSIDDCQVAPGYFIDTNTNQMIKCPTNIDGQGYYRSGWESYTATAMFDAEKGTKACTPCGKGIKSALTDISEMKGGDNADAKVAASSFSCYIEAGWGIWPTGVVLDNSMMEFTAAICDKNTYGVANTTYGLLSAPCKPCQKNLITIDQGSTDYTQCINPAGFGYSPSGANPCPVGSYSAQGTMQACTPCAPGRTTDADVNKQQSKEDCYVLPGNGVFDGSNTTDPWGVGNTTTNDTAAANLTVMPCPVGYYSTGGAVNSMCVACDTGYSTMGEGSENKEACNKCSVGYGKQGPLKACAKCPAGYYQGGPGAGDGETCVPCATTTSVYLSSKGKEAEFKSAGTTYREGATGREECVPATAQLGIDVGTQIFDNKNLNKDPKAGTIDDCLANCDPNSCCFVQFSYYNAAGANACKYINFKANSDANSYQDPKATLMFYKMLPSDAIAAASVGGIQTKAMSSGLYARCDIPSSLNMDDVGSYLDVKFSLTDNTLADCKAKCDMMSTCSHFTVTDNICRLRGGVDVQDVRTFYQNPANPVALNW